MSGRREFAPWSSASRLIVSICLDDVLKCIQCSIVGWTIDDCLPLKLNWVDTMSAYNNYQFAATVSAFVMAWVQVRDLCYMIVWFRTFSAHYTRVDSSSTQSTEDQWKSLLHIDVVDYGSSLNTCSNERTRRINLRHPTCMHECHIVVSGAARLDGEGAAPALYD